jgi:hypothetical protein
VGLSSYTPAIATVRHSPPHRRSCLLLAEELQWSVAAAAAAAHTMVVGAWVVRAWVRAG